MTLRLQIARSIAPALVLGVTVLAGDAKAQVPSDPNLTLRQVADSHLLIGAAISARRLADDPRYAKLVATHFNCLTAGNEMKPDALQRIQGKFTFETADGIVAFAQAHEMQVIGHTLLWHNQAPAWMFQDNDRKPLPREVALANLKNHIQTVVRHFKGKVKGWDVVNEAISDDAKEVLRDTPARRAIGDDYVLKAFEFAHEADPNVELYYNDYNIERDYKRDRAIQLIRQIKAAGLRIDAVGIQGHWMLEGPRLAELDHGLKALSDVGVRIMITEMDVDVLPRKNGATADLSATEREGMDPYKGGLPDEVQQKLAQRYGELFSLILKYQPTRITIWGVTDQDTWLNSFPVRGRTNYPMLFDRQYLEKPAFDAVRRALQAPVPLGAGN